MKHIYISIFFILNLFVTNNVIADQYVIKELQRGGKLVFIRHALAPGNGDPDNFNINDCSTQRNLNQEGKAQSEKIGNFFKINKIKIDKVLSSEWCRCKDTAKIAFGDFETFNALNSFYEERFADNKTSQMKDLTNFISDWKNDSNLIIITHYVVILEILNRGTISGEMIISDKKLNILGSFQIN